VAGQFIERLTPIPQIEIGRRRERVVSLGILKVAKGGEFARSPEG
jgi:hypothetical protein